MRCCFKPIASEHLNGAGECSAGKEDGARQLLHIRCVTMDVLLHGENVRRMTCRVQHYCSQMCVRHHFVASA